MGYAVRQNACPHCGGPAKIRSSQSITPTFKTIYFHCQDETGCGHVYVGQLELVHSIHPSKKPNPRCRMPLIQVGRARPRQQPEPANDDTPSANLAEA